MGEATWVVHKIGAPGEDHIRWSSWEDHLSWSTFNCFYLISKGKNIPYFHSLNTVSQNEFEQKVKTQAKDSRRVKGDPHGIQNNHE